MNGGVLTIKVNPDCVCASHTLRSMSGNKPLTDQQRAILLLLGAYNSLGRDLDLDEVIRLQTDFDAIVRKVEILIENSRKAGAK